LETNVPLRNRMTSRGVVLTRRRVDERVELEFVDDDLSKSLSVVPDELKPNVVVFVSILVASSAMMTTLAFGSKTATITTMMMMIRR